MTAPREDSWYEDALKIPRPHTLKGLAKLTPNEFELFALLVISSIYGKSGLQFGHTPFVHDRGRDADAEYVLGVGLDAAMQFQFSIWLEVKQRSTTHVGKKDVGSHVVDASIQRAHAIIFVTNSAFSKNLAGWLTSFSTRTGVQHKLIDGAELLKYAAAHLEDGAPVPHAAADHGSVAETDEAVTAVAWFSLSPSDVRSRIAPHSVIARLGRPLYLNFEITVPRRHKPFKARLDIRSNGLGADDYHPRAQDTPDERLFASGDVITAVHNFWPSGRRVWSGSDFHVTFDASDAPPLHVTFLNDVELEYVSLPDVPLGNQQRTYSALWREVYAWKTTAASRVALLTAPPGAGKSHLLARLRRTLAAERLSEIYVDCESVRDDRMLFRQVVQELLPLPTAVIDADLRDAVAHWCAAFGVSADTTHDVVEDLCGVGDGRSRLSPRHRADLLAMLLGQHSSVTPQVVIVEDLHKAQPSLLTLLWQLIGAVRDSGRGRVLFVLATRPYKNDTTEVRAAWLERLADLANANLATVFDLEQPTRRAAADFLAAAVEGFEPYNREDVVAAVGTSPYELREALLFLLQQGALTLRDGETKPLAVANPTLLVNVVASDKLRQVTEERLKTLFANHPAWLQKFLLGGAAYGRAFASGVIAGAVGIDDDDALNEAIATCGRWSVAMQSSEHRDWLEFDHDLVRDAVLRIAPARQRMRVGGQVYERLRSSAPQALLARLAYQGGFAREAFDHAVLAADEARRGERLDDVVELNQLAIQTLDPELGALSIPDGTAEYGARFDSAIRFATGVRIPGLNAADVDRSVLKLLIENLDCLASVGSGSSGLSANTLSEAKMIVERTHDRRAGARLTALEGRLAFERDDVRRAVALHETAEAQFAGIGLRRDRARSENLIRLAICHRTLGDYDRSFEDLRQAMHTCVRRDWGVLNKIRNNTGAIYLKKDWGQARYHWKKELAQARRHGLEARVAHALLGLSFLDLFDGWLEEGAEKTRAALEIVNRLHLDNQSVRAALNMSVYHILRAEPDDAMTWLQEGEKTALRHHITRRLWRIVANMATVHEMRGETQLAAVRDEQVVSLLQPPVDGRQILALVNVVLRKQLDTLPLPQEALRYASFANGGRAGELPDLMGNYIAELPAGARFLLTE